MVALATRRAAGARQDVLELDRLCAFIARHLHQPLTWLWDLPVDQVISLHSVTVDTLEAEGKVKREKP